jgi:glucose/arabinose dehydrogenase
MTEAAMLRNLSCIALLLLTTAAAPAPRYRVVEVARGLEVPWSIAFAPDGRVLVTERPGRLRVIVKGVLQPQPLFTFRDISSHSEEGLMGLALHPDFAKNHWLYVSYATSRGGALSVEVVRYRETGLSLIEPKTIVAGLPAARFHAGCRLRFGPDRKLYVTTGDATDRQIAQQMTSLGGKILRVNDDGTIPADNPFPKSPIWTLGNSNPQGIDWDPVSGLLFETEHGPSGFDGPGGGDEVNIIEKGRNYGWPVVHHRQSRAGFVSPLLEYTPAVAPASGTFWRNEFWFGCLRGEHVHRVVLDAKDRRRVVSEEKLFTTYGRIREVAAAPDGSLWFSTSNRDGRGDRRDGDDRIYRVVP